MQEMLFEDGGPICERCGARLKVNAIPGSEAKMLRRSKVPKGLCINCAVQDWLRNTYPPNILLAESGPKILLYPIIQEKFADLMRAGLSDATPDEIDWQRVVENWDLPFPKKIKPSPMNPCSQRELEEIAAGKRPGLSFVPPEPDPLGGKMVITSFEDINKLSPGLGDNLKRCLNRNQNEEGSI